MIVAGNIWRERCTRMNEELKCYDFVRDRIYMDAKMVSKPWKVQER